MIEQNSAASKDAKMIETLRQELESAIGVANTHMKMIVAGELTPFSGILRVQYLMSFRRRLVDECGYDLQRADALIDWQSIGIWSKLMAETVPTTHISGKAP